ncbi:MAG: exodeoxyribonuclease VII large subunit [Verrucomicrobia bacterium]|nr:exodeoxyribonuclease VII large subunit [Verrucomicrobiota bacterium]
MESIFSVTELTHAIKKQLESKFALVVVRGEISNFKEQASGHHYFTLKDAESQISAVFFRGNNKSLTRPLKNGDQVIIRGELSVYAPRGNYQIIVRDLQYAGVGELLLKLHELKAKLQAKGWFDPQHKKPLPHIPKTIGVVTSPTGAVIQDILNVLSRRLSNFHLILNPVKVQGDGAAREIALAIDDFNKYSLADVLIVGRGGGSLEDLWAFNEEIVAEAIFRSKIPIVSAVGHETDVSIADFVADVRAPTPSAAAELVSAEKAALLQALYQMTQRFDLSMHHILHRYEEKLYSMQRQSAFSSPFALLGTAAQRLDDLQMQIDLGLQQRMSLAKTQLQTLDRMKEALSPAQRIPLLRQKLGQLASHLRSIDPKNLLSKGYAMVFQENGTVITSSTEALEGESVRLQWKDGQKKAIIAS